MRIIWFGLLNLFLAFNARDFFFELLLLHIKNPLVIQSFISSNFSILLVPYQFFFPFKFIVKLLLSLHLSLLMSSSNTFHFNLSLSFQIFNFLLFGQIFFILSLLFFLVIQFLLVVVELLNRTLGRLILSLSHCFDSFNSNLLFLLFLKCFLIIFAEQDFTIHAWGIAHIAYLTLFHFWARLFIFCDYAHFAWRHREEIGLFINFMYGRLLKLTYEIAFAIIIFNSRYIIILWLRKFLIFIFTKKFGFVVFMLIHLFFPNYWSPF